MAKRMLIFLTFITVGVTYLGLRLAAGVPAPYSNLLIAFVVVMLAGLFIYPLSFRSRSAMTSLPTRAQRIKRWLIYMDMGFLSFVAALVVARDVLLWPITLVKPELHDKVFSGEATALMMGVALLMLIIGVWQAARSPHVARVPIVIDGAPKELDGFTIAQISDVHLSAGVNVAQVDRIVNKLNELNPDLIVATGDIGDGPARLLAPLSERFRKLKSTCLYITGNHEYYWNANEWIEAFKNAGMRPLLNAHLIVEKRGVRLLVAGIVDPAAQMLGQKPDIESALRNAPGDVAAKILLAHNPSFSKAALEAGFDLQLSGHTHAGQFFPWTLVVGRVHEFAKGLGRTGHLQVYVNQGTGSWGPPIRLGTRTEISLLELRSRTT